MAKAHDGAGKCVDEPVREETNELSFNTKEDI